MHEFCDAEIFEAIVSLIFTLSYTFIALEFFFL